MNQQTAIIDPDETFRNLLISELTQQGYLTWGYESAESFLQTADLFQVKLVICEVSLPGISGIELCTRLKSDQEHPEIALIFSSSRKTETDRLIGLSVGATDYVSKPCSARELALRARAVLLRTASAQPPNMYSNGSIHLDLNSERAWADSIPLRLSRLDYKILRTLLRSVGKVFSRRELLDQVWGDHSDILDRSVDAHIQILRAKLGPAREDLETIQGAGYRIRKHEESQNGNRVSGDTANVVKPLIDRHRGATERR